ncbi:MAG: peptidoglycan-binding domain-containing protein [Bdellovibrionales bacterium]
MTTFIRKCAFSLALACLALTLGVSPAPADEPGPGTGTAPCGTVQKVQKKIVRHAKKSAKKSRAKKSKADCETVRKAQEQLKRLGYYTGKIDCILGPQTTRAIKNFQRDHGLKPDGILGKNTMRALEEASQAVGGSSIKQPFLTHDEVLITDDDDIHQDYQMPLEAYAGSRFLRTRFAGLNVTEAGSGMDKRYNVNLNGEPLLMVGGQSSVINVSKTYALGDEDVIILTSYNPESALCSYEHHALILAKEGTKMLEIENCTRGYNAAVDNGSLIITFPERDADRALGAVWRLEGTTVRRL